MRIETKSWLVSLGCLLFAGVMMAISVLIG